MGTRGYKIIRFRGRYYCFYNHFDSYPANYGEELVDWIPDDPEEYQKWLAEQRAIASKWDSALENFLHVKRPNAEETNDQELDDQHSGTASEVSEGAPLNWFHGVYVIDLDREIFSVDHGAHFTMRDIPRSEWIHALAKTGAGRRLLLPDLLPEHTTTSLVVRKGPPDVVLHRLYEGLSVGIVTSKGINGFHPTQRHEPLFCARIFQTFQRAQMQVLAHLLLGWKPDDFPFREIAFTILCLATGRQNVSLVEDVRVANDDAHGSANLMNNTNDDVEPEFLAHMGVGSHFNHNPAGSAPKSSMYWFEGILVHLVARLDNPDIVPESVARVVQCARESCSRQSVDAVLISIAHIVLVRVFAGDKVQHTKPLPLFIFRDQPCQEPRERFSESELNDLLQRKERLAARIDARIERQAGQNDDPDLTENEGDETEGSEYEYEEGVGGSISFDLPKAEHLSKNYYDIAKTEPSFLNLALFLHSSTRSPVQLSAGCFPMEICRLINENIEDVGTHGAWMAVSSEFREMCLQNSSIIEGWELLPNEATMAYTHAREVWNEQQPSCYRPEQIKRLRYLQTTEPGLMPGIRAVEQATASGRDITIDRVRSGHRKAADQKIWRVVVGKHRHRRSLLLDMNLCFKDVEKHLQG